MKYIIFLAIFAGTTLGALGQISCSNAVYRDTTVYTNGMAADSLFFICTGQSAVLNAVPSSGTPGWTFQWSSFVAATNSWTPLNTVTDVPTSSQTVANGGYRVQIFDGTNTLVDTDIVWVCRVQTNPTINVNTIPAGCGAVNLSAVFITGNITGYYNPPTDTGEVPQLILDANSEMSICFTATHTWVSDLAFYVVGPASCGSPTLLLSPNPGANGQGTVCNSGNNVSNLCFSTESTANLDVCAGAPFTLQGTYGTYGPGATAINWSALYGCDANASGWAVQIYDCIGGDVGTLTDATLTFSGINNQGDPMTSTYSTPSGYSSAITDNSCSAGTASIFQVGAVVTPATPILHNFTYEWTADPPFPIPNSTSALNITLNPGPTVDTYFTLTMGGNNPGTACGGIGTDTELFDYIDPTTALITPVDPSYCEQSGMIQLTSDQSGGSWNGTGITDAVNGTFDPAVAGEGTWTVNYVPSSACVTGASIDINIVDQPVAVITPVPPICSSGNVFNLQVDIPGGTFSGPGIIDGEAGSFDPSVVGEGIANITYEIAGDCPVYGATAIDVVFQAPLELTAPTNQLCIDADSIQISANIAGGSWSGNGITDTSNGWFDAQVAGLGQHNITYSYSDVCMDQETIVVEVVDSTLSINPVNDLCLSSMAVVLTASYVGGVWSGTGITNGIVGVFDPSVLPGVGNYTVYYNSNNACGALDSVTISVDGVPSLSITVPDQVCADDGVILLEASEPGGVWSGDGILDALNGTFDPAAAGSGAANINYTINATCIYSADDIINVNPTPAVNAGQDVSICPGEGATIIGSGAANYSWSPASGLSSPNAASTAASPSSTTTYTLTGTSAAGCTDTDQITVTVFPAANIVVQTPISVCDGEDVELSATGGVTYNWTGQNVADQNAATTTATPNESTTYSVFATDANGCDGTAEVEVTVISPNAYFIPSTTEGMAPLVVSFDNGSTGDSFTWDFGNGNTLVTSVIDASVIEEFAQEGVYSVTLTAEEDGCISVYRIDIHAFYVSGIILVPNIVTLGGDGKNDEFRIESRNLRSLDVNVYDRWGKHVGNFDKPSGSWDPTDFGTGTYYYVLKAEGYDGKTYERAGNITVISQ